ncbi:MAG: sugar transferase [Pirellulales bacterium]|nr:sugar transferase [Pirellulales bacterium]
MSTFPTAPIKLPEDVSRVFKDGAVIFHPRREARHEELPEVPNAEEKSAYLQRQLVDALTDGAPLVGPAGNRSRSYQAVKRGLDVVGALFFIVLFSPIMLATYITLLITTRGKPVFVQERIGYRGLPFRMYKFRTMRLDAESVQAEVKNEQSGPVFKNRRDPRITKIGRWLRSFSIDEMPQLFNVLAGDMSLVGPRPPVSKEVAKYERWQLQRLAIKPGLTCLWQISGRCEIGFDDWVRMDIWYLENQSFLVDLKLLFKTPWSVLSRRGAY